VWHPFVIIPGMCLRCDGYSEDDVNRMVDLHIRVYGYHVTQVEDRDPWCYTIGLEQSFGHPEVVTTTLKMSAQVELIQTVAAMLTGTGEIDHAQLGRLGIRLVPVHRGHLATGLVGGWEAFYARPATPGSFLQVLPPKNWLCPCHRNAVTRLDRPPTTRRTK